MKIHTLFLFAVPLVCSSAAVLRPQPYPVKREVLPDYFFVSIERDSTLDLNHAEFDLQFEPVAQYFGKQAVQVELSCNGVIERFPIPYAGKKHTLTVSPGKYRFQLVTNAGHQEITTDSIAILPGYRICLSFGFREANIQEVVLKPVVYVYSEAPRNVSILLKPKGAFTFTYPSYADGWKGIAHPDGSMTIAGKNYPYLFWEGEQQNVARLTDYSRGFIVEKADVTAFLEEKLTRIGFNEKEKTDFITFWGPRMAQSEKGFAHFLFNEDYDAIATLEIIPAPKTIFRVYLLWTPLENGADLSPRPQQLPAVDRTGFYVIEWGGSEITLQEAPVSALQR